MVRGTKKKRAHLETSTPASATILLGTSASPTTTSTPLVTLTPFPQLSYLSLTTISAPSSSSAAGTSLRHAPCLRLIKCHFFFNICTASTSNRLVQNGLLKSLRSTFLRLMQKKYRWDPLHKHAIWDAWEKRASLHYKDLMYEVPYTSLCNVWSSDAFKKKREAAQRNHLQGHGGQGPENRRGICTFRVVRATASAEGTNGSTTPTDEQLMFEATGGSNKGHVYSFCSQSAAIPAR
ncbi:hypothetical protein M9H77_06817 [Catharanthus roseus]|uniref:Uncharacterized protein n=1 Tax=Catharanthus roseus TaxID=4058 RepID=A0ACC0BTG0_CATRO|nr:hypothetical protein M9H77_06817 [Catharanthus roseus]